MGKSYSLCKVSTRLAFCNLYFEAFPHRIFILRSCKEQKEACAILMSSLSSANMKIINTSWIFYSLTITATFPENICYASYTIGKNRSSGLVTTYFKKTLKTKRECMILIYPVCEVATKDQDIHHRHPLEWDDNAILLNFLLHWWSRFWSEKNYNEILKQLIIIEIILQKRNSCQI